MIHQHRLKYLTDMEHLSMWIQKTRDGAVGTSLPEFISGMG